MQEKKYTTISISKETLRELQEVCKKTQTYDDLIRELLASKKSKVK